MLIIVKSKHKERLIFDWLFFFIFFSLSKKPNPNTYSSILVGFRNRFNHDIKKVLLNPLTICIWGSVLTGFTVVDSSNFVHVTKKVKVCYWDYSTLEDRTIIMTTYLFGLCIKTSSQLTPCAPIFQHIQLISRIFRYRH